MTKGEKISNIEKLVHSRKGDGGNISFGNFACKLAIPDFIYTKYACPS